MVNYSAVKSSRVIKIQDRQATENGIDFLQSGLLSISWDQLAHNLLSWHHLLYVHFKVSIFIIYENWKLCILDKLFQVKKEFIIIQ